MSVRQSEKDQALLLTNGECWLCGMELDEAAHIIPRAEFYGIRRAYPRLPQLAGMRDDKAANLVILCPSHRRLYDRGDWTIVPAVEHLILWVRQVEVAVLEREPHSHPLAEDIFANVFINKGFHRRTHALTLYAPAAAENTAIYQTRPREFLRVNGEMFQRHIQCHRASLCIRADMSLHGVDGPEQMSTRLLDWLLRLWKFDDRGPLELEKRPHDLLPDEEGSPTREQLTTFDSTFVQAPGGAVQLPQGIGGTPNPGGVQDMILDCFKDSKSHGGSDCPEERSILYGKPSRGGAQDTIQDYLDSISQGSSDFPEDPSHEAVDDEPPVSLKSLQESGSVVKRANPFCIAGPHFSTNDILREAYGLKLGDTLSL